MDGISNVKKAIMKGLVFHVRSLYSLFELNYSSLRLIYMNVAIPECHINWVHFHFILYGQQLHFRIYFVFITITSFLYSYMFVVYPMQTRLMARNFIPKSSFHQSNHSKRWAIKIKFWKCFSCFITLMSCWNSQTCINLVVNMY